MAREAIASMAAAGGGVIVNVIGTGGLIPSAGYMVGGAANAALNHFTKALAAEGAKHKVRVVGINPGPILTDRLRLFTERRAQGTALEDVYRRMTPLGRPGRGGRPACGGRRTCEAGGSWPHGGPHCGESACESLLW